MVKQGENSPSTLQTMLDLHHDLVKKRLHITSNSGSGVSNRDEGCSLGRLNICSRECETGLTKIPLIGFVKLSQKMCHSLVKEMLREGLCVVSCQRRNHGDNHFANVEIAMRLEA
jgi:hypothetical protein